MAKLGNRAKMPSEVFKKKISPHKILHIVQARKIIKTSAKKERRKTSSFYHYKK